MQCNSLILFTSKHKGSKVKITLWGEQAHFLNKDVIAKPTTIVVTSTVVISSQYQGKFIIFCMINLIMIPLINVCSVFSVLSLKTTSATRLYANLDIPEAK
jgi:hypothetical protein